LIGGAVGLCLSVLMASYRVGLARAPGMEEASVDPSPHRDRVRAFAPYLLLIAVLIVTRVRFLPFRAWLNAESPALAVDLGSLGRLSASVALVLRLDSIFGTASAWSYSALFVPALIPFVLVVLISVPILGIDLHTLRTVVADTT